MQELENCMFSLRVHCDEQTYLVSSDRPFVVVLGKLLYMSAMRGGRGLGRQPTLHNLPTWRH